ncbi:hypothetical protein LSM04_009256 [Trypanosoma melophagium]|uniref:uncharacterized protein n=1 Tax=Trypanosoma melophagium TaxID=715481 RepID=UPI00351AAE5A|nr:hypothetical protein LSM04_009256 [Trypanosoma melophagium]
MGCNGSRPKTADGEEQKNKKSKDKKNNSNDVRVNTAADTPISASTSAAVPAGGKVRASAPPQTAGNNNNNETTTSGTSTSAQGRTKPPQSSASSTSVESDAGTPPAMMPRPYREPFSEEPIHEPEVMSAAPLPLIVYNERVNQYKNRNSSFNDNRESNRSSNRYDNDYMMESFSSTFSAPQLFRISPTQRAERGEGTWEWWYEQVDNLRITKDCTSRARLEDIQNRLMRQYDTDKSRVELDLCCCYMERSAPYVLGRLLASPSITEIRWITALRLDGNYFTDEGFGNMLAVMSIANESRPILPLLKQLYLNNMNLDANSIHGILFYLFPFKLSPALTRGINVQRPPPLTLTADARGSSIVSESVGYPLRAYVPFDNTPHIPLFPSLEVLTFCDNPGIGNRGFALLLRCLLAPHYERRELFLLDLSRCGIDEVGVGYLREYLTQLPISRRNGENVVSLRRVALIGNRHSINRARSVSSNEGSHFQSHYYDNNNYNSNSNNNINHVYNMRKKSGSHYHRDFHNGNDDDDLSRERDVSIVL